MVITWVKQRKHGNMKEKGEKKKRKGSLLPVALEQNPLYP